MGLKDFLSKSKNYLFGTAAKLELYVNGNDNITYTLNIVVDDQDISAEKIYINIENIEHVEIKLSLSPESDPNEDPFGGEETRTVKRSSILFSKEIILAENINLEKEQEYNYNGTIPLSELGVLSYKGNLSEVKWTMQAFIESSGNNPNSELIIL